MVFTGIAVAFAGGFLMIWFYGQEWFLNFNFFGENLRDLFQMHPINLSVAVWVGIIALLGVSAETGVVMLLYLDLAYEKFKRNGMLNNLSDLRESIFEGAVKRIRPKMMTVLTTMLGLLPILIGLGAGSDVMKRIAAPMVGGILTSMIMELTLFPAIFYAIKKRELKKIINKKQKDIPDL